MVRLYVIVCLCLFLPYISFSQAATLKGTVKDGPKNEPLEGASVVQLPANGALTDEKGNYELKVTPGDITVVISYMGMKADTQRLTVKDGETKVLDIGLGGNKAVELEQVVIGETKTNIKIQKVTQSVDIMKARVLEANNITNLQNAMSKVPGVTLLDGQMSVRGGSGYAYGAGSRVMLVVDEMPLMSADRSDIKWALIPMENIEQLEITKGASTVQYGASALNGVINVTTGYARDTPSTHFTLFYEGVGKPRVDSFQWWKRNGDFFNNPNTMGMSFVHKQKFGDVDFVLSGILNGSQSHLRDDRDYFTRFNTKLRWQPSKLKRLTLELSAVAMYRRSGFQFWWKDAGNPYLPAGGVSLNERYFYAFIDPKFRFVDKKNNTHKLFMRYSRQDNMDGVTDFHIFRVDYQFRHDFGNIARIVTGISNEHGVIKDGTLGEHKTDQGGIFILGELNWKWLRVNAGIREEFRREDQLFFPTTPVCNLGLNFEVKKYNYIRASFGQAYRFASLGEKYITYNLAGVQILPNPDSLKPEKGFTAELGYKRSLKIGNWLGYIDAAFFWTEFRDMLEFTFNVKIDNSTLQITPYFQSRNVTHARIFGWEVSAYGEGKMGKNVDFTTMLGYTYFYGVDLADTTVTRNVGDFLGDAFKKFALPTPSAEPADPAADYVVWDSLTRGMLKYRNPHTFKADFDFILFNKVRLGTSMQYYSFMTRIDRVFDISIPGAKTVRQERLNKGDFVWDLRAGYSFNHTVSLNFLVKNILNSSYQPRVARPSAPRSYTVQMVVNLGGRSRQLQAPRFGNI